jgi:(2R)-3-sulfolactate dehydrogenase (NADP+)
MLTLSHARTLARQALARAGLPEPAGARTADAIVLADAWGRTGHGLMRLPYYLDRLAAGGFRPDAQLKLVADRGALVSYDGGGGLGHWQVAAAVATAVERARVHGVAAVGVGDSGHCGALGVYLPDVLAAGQTGLIFSNGPAVMPAWGGDRPVLSTGPLAAGIPTTPQWTIIDLATSAVARGTIAGYARRGEQLESGWAFDAGGSPTTDPQLALAGMLAPMAGAKGYALALLVELLTGGLVGPRPATDVADMFAPADNGRLQGIAHLVVTIDGPILDVAGDQAERLRRIADAVEGGGGRLPGRDRRGIDELPPDFPLEVAVEVERDLRRRAEGDG